MGEVLVLPHCGAVEPFQHLNSQDVVCGVSFSKTPQGRVGYDKERFLSDVLQRATPHLHWIGAALVFYANSLPLRGHEVLYAHL